MYVRLRISEQQAKEIKAFWKHEHSLWYEKQNKKLGQREIKFGFHDLGTAYTWLTCMGNQGMLYQDKLGWVISYWGRRHAVGGFALPTEILEKYSNLSSLEIEEFQSSRLDVSWWKTCTGD
jgi:hypothetical protein